MTDGSYRSPTQRDRDRILYSEEFRRLGGVTQVASGSAGMALHNRLTHSLKVEQVGVSIFTSLAVRAGDGSHAEPRADRHAIATACLAHDLGHPPFGHAGEEELNELVVCERHLKEGIRPYERRRDDPCRDCKLEDGFEGNAQSLRIVAVLAAHKDSTDRHFGLDLTRESLAATIKYPWLRGAVGKKPQKWGAYDCDREILQWATGGADEPSLNAQMMDWADDISYAVHDLEDFYRAGTIPLNDYKPQTATFASFLAYIQGPHALGPLPEEEIEAFGSLTEFFPSARFTGQSEHIRDLDQMRSTLITQFISTLALEDSALVRNAMQDRMNSILKQLIWYHIIDEPRLASIQIGQRRVLRETFSKLEELAKKAYRIGEGSATPDERSERRLPYQLQRTIAVNRAQQNGYTDEQKVYRGILDFMSGLSDTEAYQLHAVLQGRELVGHL